jgi:hypothetical protein
VASKLTVLTIKWHTIQKYIIRGSIRLKGYDYAMGGLYFITIYVKNRQCLLGKIENEQMFLNETGENGGKMVS